MITTTYESGIGLVAVTNGAGLAQESVIGIGAVGEWVCSEHPKRAVERIATVSINQVFMQVPFSLGRVTIAKSYASFFQLREPHAQRRAKASRGADASHARVRPLDLRTRKMPNPPPAPMTMKGDREPKHCPTWAIKTGHLRIGHLSRLTDWRSAARTRTEKGNALATHEARVRGGCKRRVRRATSYRRLRSRSIEQRGNTLRAFSNVSTNESPYCVV